jgi:predicted O-methyltransferase YrrM
LIVADNMVRQGAVIEANSKNAAVQGVRRFNEIVANEPRLSATAIQTVGDKGYDGFVLVRVMGWPAEEEADLGSCAGTANP